MANYSRWEDVKKKRPGPDAETRAGVEQELALGQLIYDLRTEAPVSASASSPSGWVPRWWEFLRRHRRRPDRVHRPAGLPVLHDPGSARSVLRLLLTLIAAPRVAIKLKQF